MVRLTDNTGRWGWSDDFRVDTAGSLVVREPSRSSVWLHGDGEVVVSLAVAAYDTVRADVYKGNSLIGVFASWTMPDSDVLSGDSAIPAAWGIGDDYRVRVAGISGNYGWSDYFSIRADTTPVFAVIYPDSSTFWHAGIRTDSVVLALLVDDSILGDSALCILARGLETVDTLGKWQALDTVLSVKLSMTSASLHGSDYRPSPSAVIRCSA
jgi:hypothetical protein